MYKDTKDHEKEGFAQNKQQRNEERKKEICHTDPSNETEPTVTVRNREAKNNQVALTVVKVMFQS